MSRLGIDTELLTLLVVGRTDPGIIDQHRRLQGYSETEFELLTQIASRFSAIVVSAHVLAETSNLLSQIREPQMGILRQSLAGLILEMTESDLKSCIGAKRSEIAYLGLTDTMWLAMADEIDCLLAVDGNLINASRAIGIEVIDFRFEREFARTQKR